MWLVALRHRAGWGLQGRGAILETAPYKQILETAPYNQILETAPYNQILKAAPYDQILEAAPYDQILVAAWILRSLKNKLVVPYSETLANNWSNNLQVSTFYFVSLMWITVLNLKLS